MKMEKGEKEEGVSARSSAQKRQRDDKFKDQMLKHMESEAKVAAENARSGAAAIRLMNMSSLVSMISSARGDEDLRKWSGEGRGSSKF